MKPRIITAISALALMNSLEVSSSAQPAAARTRDVVRHDAVAIEVHNFGPAIPKGVQGVLFEAFRRDPTRVSHRSSIGLGLFIASEIVRAHGGSIAVRSPEQNGTTFSIVLPRGQASIGLIPTESAPPQVH